MAMLTGVSIVYAAEEKDCTVSIFYYPVSTSREVRKTFTSASTVTRTETSKYVGRNYLIN